VYRYFIQSKLSSTPCGQFTGFGFGRGTVTKDPNAPKAPDAIGKCRMPVKLNTAWEICTSLKDYAWTADDHASGNNVELLCQFYIKQETPMMESCPNGLLQKQESPQSNRNWFSFRYGI